MGVHASGDGAAWDSLEALDVDQPHGLDYRESVHMAKAVRKRMDQEHVTFADATVGGIHMPGGVAVLGMELTDEGGDITAPVVGDGTYRARGLVWAWDGSSDARLWCSTKAAGNSTTGDWTLLVMHPDKQYAGGDVTWAGAHEFDASVDISGNTAIDGDLSVDGTIEAGTVNIVGDLSVGGDISVVGELYIGGDASFDGTVDFGDGVGFAAEVSVSGAFKVGGAVEITTSTFTMFGDWSDEDSDGNALANAAAEISNSYKAPTDGFISAIQTSDADDAQLAIFNDDNTSPGRLVARQKTESGVCRWTATVPISKDSYVSVCSIRVGPAANAVEIWWKPIGTGKIVGNV